MFQIKSFREIHNTHFVFSNYFRKSCPLLHNVEKYCTAGQTTDASMTHAHCMPDTKGYTHTHTHTHTLSLIM